MITKKRFIQWTLEHPGQSITLALLLSVIIGSGVRFLHIEDDVMKMLPQDIPSRVIWREIEDQFGSIEPILVGIGREGQSIYTQEALAKIWDVSRALEDLLLVDEVRGLASMDKIESVDGFMEVDELMPARDLTPEEIAAVKGYLDRNPDLRRTMVSRDGDYTRIMILPVSGVSDKELAAEVEAVTDALLQGYEVQIGGLPYVRGIITKLVRQDVIGLMRIGLILLALVLLLNLRSLTALLMVLVVIVLSAFTMVGFFGWMYQLLSSEHFNFTLLNTNMPVILLTIATADGVHILTRFFREVRERREVKSSIAATMDVLMLPVFLTSITTMAGFITLTTAPLTTIVGYGITVSFGIAWAWYLSVTFLPSVMVLKKWNLTGRALTTPGIFEKIIHATGKYVLRHPVIILSGTVVVLIFSIIGITQLRVEMNVVKFFKPGSVIRENMAFLDDKFYGSSNLAIQVRGDMKEPATLRRLEALQQQLEEEEPIGLTYSIANMIAKLHRVVMDDSVEYEYIPDTRAKVANLLTLYSMSGDPDDFNALVDYDYRNALINSSLKTVSTREMLGLVGRLEDRIESGDLADMDVRVSGLPVFLRDFTYLLISSSLRSLLLSLVLVVIISWIFFKTFQWGILAVIPLSSAILLNFGIMGWFGIELSHVTALLSAIIIGVGVDFAVHFIAQYKHFLRRGIPRDQVGQTAIDDVGYPILLNVAAVSVGFAALLFSNFVPMIYAGGLIIISMVSCALGTLTMLATIIHLMRDRVTA
ncbi:MAG: RND family transporter [Candidatus Neomarinimicrobiota bacterium]